MQSSPPARTTRTADHEPLVANLAADSVRRLEPTSTSASSASASPSASSDDTEGAEHVPGPCYIDRVPTEVLASILHHLDALLGQPDSWDRHRHRTTCLNVMRISRRFNLVAGPLVNRCIAVSPSSELSNRRRVGRDGRSARAQACRVFRSMDAQGERRARGPRRSWNDGSFVHVEPVRARARTERERERLSTGRGRGDERANVSTASLRRAEVTLELEREVGDEEGARARAAVKLGRFLLCESSVELELRDDVKAVLDRERGEEKGAARRAGRGKADEEEVQLKPLVLVAQSGHLQLQVAASTVRAS